MCVLTVTAPSSVQSVHSVLSPLTSPCDCPAYLHDRETPLVISLAGHNTKVRVINQ